MKYSDPSLKTFLHIYFDHCIQLFVLYGCENWGVINIIKKKKTLSCLDIFKNLEMENTNLEFCKHFLDVIKLCTNVAVLFCGKYLVDYLGNH